MNVRETGVRNSFPTLVFLHYFGGSSESWNEVIEGFEDQYHCLAPDLRGFGDSQHSFETFELADYVQDIRNLIAAFELPSYILVGHSMGGKIALAFAAQAPQNLQSLILIAPSPPTPEPMANDERQRLLSTHGTREAAAETINQGISRKLPPEVFDRAIGANLNSAENAWRAWLENGIFQDISESVKSIKIPVTTAVGEDDENISAELLKREIVSRIPQAKLLSIKNAKHLLPLEAPSEISNLIGRSINE